MSNVFVFVEDNEETDGGDGPFAEGDEVEWPTGGEITTGDFFSLSRSFSMATLLLLLLLL